MYSALSQKYKKNHQILQNKVVCFILNVFPRVYAMYIGGKLGKVEMLSSQDRIVQLQFHHF